MTKTKKPRTPVWVIRFEQGVKRSHGLAFRFCHDVTAEGETGAEAVEAARAKLLAEGGWDSYAKGRAEIVGRLRLYGVTLRGKKDKRKRETFYSKATSPRDAISHLRHNEAVYRHAGYLRNLDDPAVVKVETVD